MPTKDIIMFTRLNEKHTFQMQNNQNALQNQNDANYSRKARHQKATKTSDYSIEDSE